MTDLELIQLACRRAAQRSERLHVHLYQVFTVLAEELAKIIKDHEGQP